MSSASRSEPVISSANCSPTVAVWSSMGSMTGKWFTGGITGGTGFTVTLNKRQMVTVPSVAVIFTV